MVNLLFRYEDDILITTLLLVTHNHNHSVLLSYVLCTHLEMLCMSDCFCVFQELWGACSEGFRTYNYVLISFIYKSNWERYLLFFNPSKPNFWKYRGFFIWFACNYIQKIYIPQTTGLYYYLENLISLRIISAERRRWWWWRQIWRRRKEEAPKIYFEDLIWISRWNHC